MKKFRPYFSLLAPVKWKFIGAIIAGALAAVASGFGLPFMVDNVFPVIFSSKETGSVADVPEWMNSLIAFFGHEGNVQAPVVVACAMLPLVFIMRGVFGYINIYFINYTGLTVLEIIRLKVFDRLQRLSLGFHQKHKEGDLLTRVMTDTYQLQTAVVRMSNDLIIQPFTLLSALGYLIYASLQDSRVFFILIALLSLPICIFPIRWVGKKMLRKAQALQEKAGDITAAVSENLSSQREVRAYNMQDQQVEEVGELGQQFLRNHMNVIKYRHLISPMVEIVAAAGISFAIYYGAQNGMTLQSFIALVMALFFMYEPVKKIGNIHSLMKQGEASLTRLEEILNSEEEIMDPKTPQSISSVRGEIDMRGVEFGYGTNEVILHDVNLSISAGQTVALVGPSGAGKSTFVSLIPRFYEVQKGQVLLDGLELGSLAKKDLRSQIAIVSQQPLLFRGTVKENIAIGNPKASEAEIVEAAKQANAHDFIMSLPDQYESMVGERGEGVSGGQRQRIAIARAFLKDAPILILDEATSALDTESEAQIQQELKKLAEGRTTLLIAHRFSTIRDAERILVFDKTENGGEIIADGSHEELYQSCRLYKDLYDRQSG